jgi:uracil-DNA glycosylase
MNTALNSQHILTSWKEALAFEKQQPYFSEILNLIDSERINGKVIFPEKNKIFQCFKITELSAVKIVILGQDPYHGLGQAHGLCFSVPKGVPFPPSLRNIFTELKNDIGAPIPQSGDLTKWGEQGILLLNTSLTVEEGKAGSHSAIGWAKFTDKVIEAVNTYQKNVIFLLWGSHARSKKELIDTDKHIVLEAPHPSPLSAHRGFFGCQHFSKTNQILKSQGKTVINW